MPEVSDLEGNAGGSELAVAEEEEDSSAERESFRIVGEETEGGRGDDGRG